MTAKQVWRLLRRKGVKASYQSVNRFIQDYVTPAMGADIYSFLNP